jgi:hypothetical protein
MGFAGREEVIPETPVYLPDYPRLFSTPPTKKQSRF